MVKIVEKDLSEDQEVLSNYYLNEMGEEEELSEEEEEEQEKEFSIFDVLDKPRILPDPEPLTIDHLKRILNELGLIKLCWPFSRLPEQAEEEIYPSSYYTNNDKEKLLLLYVENFRKQFVYRFPNRKQLLLAADNEFDIQKMVCTTIRSTTLGIPDIESWQDCAKFLANFIEYEPLEIPTLIPKHLWSPFSVIKHQYANSFEIATTLCSLLIGLGYDAYVVSGYADSDICHRILTRIYSPHLRHKDSLHEEEEEKKETKYTLKPARDLKSKFLLQMQQREIDKVNNEKLRLDKIEEDRLLAEEFADADTLKGLRVHAWVLLLDKGRPIEEKCFIEATTGYSYPLDSTCYFGIESLWNNINYWVNMQDCTENLGMLDFDLSNPEYWEHLLQGEPIDYRKTQIDIEMEEEDIKRTKTFEEKHLDMPASWGNRIEISHAEFARKFPNGTRTTKFKRQIVKEYAPYVQEDGLITEIVRYRDFDCTDDYEIEYIYQNRHDKMIRVIWNKETDIITEFFGPGREDAVIMHKYTKGDKADNDVAERIIKYNHRVRFDALAEIKIEKRSMTETYIDRENRMYYRSVEYSKTEDQQKSESHRRVIDQIIEKFNRDLSIPASKNIAYREYAIRDRQIHLKYHYETGKVTATTRNFVKPPIAEMGEGMKFNPELTTGYCADLNEKPPRHLELFLLLQEQLAEEEKAIKNCREIEDQIAEFILLRHAEMSFDILQVDLFNQEHNQEYKKGMLEREHQATEQRAKEISEENINYLQPYLEKISCPERLTVEQCQQLRDWCLKDFKQMLLARATVIQRQYERSTEYLQRRKQWYVVNQDKLKPIEEMEYFEQINNVNFLLKALELRLNRHRQLSHYRLLNMFKYLDMHPKLRKINPGSDRQTDITIINTKKKSLN